MREKILAILQGMHPEYDYSSSSDYLEDELLDSFDVIELVTAIEEEFHVSIDGLDILPENFNHVDAIVKMIEKSGENA